MKKCIEPVINCGWRDDHGFCGKNKFAPCPSGQSHETQLMLDNYWFGKPVNQKGNKIIWEKDEKDENNK